MSQKSDRMGVYVDIARWPFGHMLMCHMFADTTEELMVMADRIGVQRKWIQKAGTADEHFDIAKGKRALAVTGGAIEVDDRTMVEFFRRRRATLSG